VDWCGMWFLTGIQKEIDVMFDWKLEKTLLSILNSEKKEGNVSF